MNSELSPSADPLGLTFYFCCPPDIQALLGRMSNVLPVTFALGTSRPVLMIILRTVMLLVQTIVVLIGLMRSHGVLQLALVVQTQNVHSV